MDVEPSPASSSTTSSGAESRDSLLAKKDALEAKLDAIVNIDTTKKEKMNPRSGTNDKDKEEDENKKKEFIKKYLRLKIYLLTQFN